MSVDDEHRLLHVIDFCTLNVCLPPFLHFVNVCSVSLCAVICYFLADSFNLLAGLRQHSSCELFLFVPTMLGETVSSVEVSELFALLCNSHPE